SASRPRCRTIEITSSSCAVFCDCGRLTWATPISFRCASCFAHIARGRFGHGNSTDIVHAHASDAAKAVSAAMRHSLCIGSDYLLGEAIVANRGYQDDLEHLEQARAG